MKFLCGEILGDQVTDGELVERQIVCILNHTGIMIADAGRRNAHGINIGNGNAILCADTVAQLCDAGRDLLCGALCLGGNACLVYDVIILINNTCRNIGAAQVDSYTVHKISSLSLRAVRTSVLLSLLY